MQPDRLALIACFIVIVGTIVYGIIMLKVAKTIHETRKMYDEYLRTPRHISLLDLYKKEDLK